MSGIQKTAVPGVVLAVLLGALIMSLSPAEFSSIIDVDRPAPPPGVAAQMLDPLAIQQELDPLAIQQELDPPAIQQELDPPAIQQELDPPAIQQELDGIDDLLPRADLSPVPERRISVAPAPQSTGAAQRELDAYEELRDRRHELVRLARAHVARQVDPAKRVRSGLSGAAPLSFPDHALAAAGHLFSAASSRSFAFEVGYYSRAMDGVLRAVRRMVPARAFRFAFSAESTVDRAYHQLRNGYAGGYDSIAPDSIAAISFPADSAFTAYDFESITFAVSVLPLSSSHARTPPRLASRSYLVLSNASTRRVRALSFGELI